MKKTIVTVSTAAVLGFTGAFLTETVEAEKSVDEIDDERSEIKENLSDAEEEIADILLELEDLNKEIDRVDEAREENKEQVDETKDKITKKEKEVDGLQDKIKKLEEKIEKRFDIMKERIVSYQKSGGDVKYLEVLFDSSSFSDFINRTSAVSTISDADQDLMEQQEKDKKEVEDKQGNVEEKLNELEDEKAEIEAIKDTIEEQKEQNESKKEKLQKKEDSLEDKKSDLETDDNDLEDLEADVRKSIKETESSEDDADKSTSNSGSKKKKNNDTKIKEVASNNSSGDGSALTAGEKYIGNSDYVFGGGRTQSDIDSGHFDCSGFVSWSYSQEDVSLPATTDGLASSGKEVSYSDIEPGDLVFFDTYKKNGHVGIYLGDDQFIGSQDSTGVAKVDMSNPYWEDNFDGHVRRIK